MLSRVGRNLGVQLLALAVTFIDRFVVVGLLVHHWGAQLYADWVVLFSAAGLLQLGEFGLNIYYGNVWQRATALGDRPGFARMLRVALGIAGIQALVLSLAAVPFVALSDQPAVFALSGAGEGRLVFLLLVAFSILAVLRGSLSQLYRGDGRYARGMIVTLIGTLALLVATLLVVLAGGGLLSLAGTYLLCQIIFGIGLMAWDLKRCFPALRFVPAMPRASEWRDAWRSARWLALEQCAPVAWLQLPILMLGLADVGGSALVGFVLLRTLVGLARQVSNMLSIALGVELADRIHTEPEMVGAQLKAAGRWLAAVSGVLGVSVWLFGPPLLALWSDDAALYDPVVAAWLVLGTFAAASAAPIAKLLAFTNRAKPNAAAWTVQLVIGLGLAGLLVSSCGAAGVAAGLAIGEVIGMGLILPLLAGPVLALPMRRYWLDWGGWIALSTIWCLMVGAAVTAWLDVSRISGLLAALAVWAFCGAFPVLVFALLATWLRSTLGRLLRQKLLDQRQKA